MSNADLLEQLQHLDPAPIDGVPTCTSQTAQRVLHAAVGHERIHAAPTHRYRSRIAVVGVAAAFTAGTLGLMNVGSTPSAAATLRSAMTAANQSATGRARMTVEGRVGEQAKTGIIEMEWNGQDESYRMSEGNTVTGEFRYVAGVRYQRDRNRPTWRIAGEDLNNQLLNAPDGERLATMHPGTQFTQQGTDVINGEQLDHFMATGDLRPLDTNRSGFIFGVNGATGVHTTSLDIWLDNTKTVRRVRMSFTGTPDGLQVDATATTDIADLGAAITIDKPDPVG